jgi:N-acylglucosamine-6-phosphate 2-epimerase
MNAVLEKLRGGLIVSVQANDDSLLNAPATIAILARVAQANGAVGVRIEGVQRISAVRGSIDLPVVGIVKRRYHGFEPYITSTREEAEAAAAAGADIVAFDATARKRFGDADVAALVEAIHKRKRLAMADCADLDDGLRASEAGADIVATTLAGYTVQTQSSTLPALDLVAALAQRHPFVVCEGGVAYPSQVRAALRAGASAIVVGTAITNVDVLVRRFAACADRKPDT